MLQLTYGEAGLVGSVAAQWLADLHDHKSVRYVPVTFWCNDRQKLQVRTLLTCGFNLRRFTP